MSYRYPLSSRESRYVVSKSKRFYMDTDHEVYDQDSGEFLGHFEDGEFTPSTSLLESSDEVQDDYDAEIRTLLIHEKEPKRKFRIQNYRYSVDAGVVIESTTAVEAVKMLLKITSDNREVCSHKEYPHGLTEVMIQNGHMMWVKE